MADTAAADGFPEHLDDAFFAGVIDVSPEPYVVVDLDGTIRWVSRTADQLLGDGPGAAVGRNMLEFVTPQSVEAALAAFGQLTRPDRPDTGWVGPPIPLDLQLGTERTVSAEVRLVPPADPSFPGAIINLQIHAPETALYETIERLIRDEPMDQVMQSILHLICLESPYSVPAIGWGWDGRRFTSSVADVDAPTIDGDPLPADLDGATPWSLRLEGQEAATDDNLDAVDPRLRRAAAERGIPACWVYPIASSPDRPIEAAVVVWRRTAGFPLLNLARRMERITGLVRLALDAQRSRQHLRTAARTDAVTGLLNRTALAERLADLDRHPTGRVEGVLYCDLDHFKHVNDQHGHPVGDKALVVAAERIRSRVRAGDLVARVGGDEFIVVSTADSPDEIGVLAERLVAAFDDPISVEDLKLEVGLSVGWTAADATMLGRDLTGEQLVERADAALLQAKADGKGRVARG